MEWIPQEGSKYLVFIDYGFFIIYIGIYSISSIAHGNQNQWFQYYQFLPNIATTVHPGMWKFVEVVLEEQSYKIL